MTQPSPPWLTRHVLKHVFAGQDRDCALSDLDEEFEVRAARDGAVAARHWYRDQARRSVIPALQRRLMGFDLSLRIPLIVGASLGLAGRPRAWLAGGIRRCTPGGGARVECGHVFGGRLPPVQHAALS